MMEADPHDGPISFEYLFLINVPDILEHIFFSLDYSSYKSCLEVCSRWRELLTSKSYIARGRLVFRKDIREDERKLHNCFLWEERRGFPFIDEFKSLLASGMVDINCKWRGETLLHRTAQSGEHKESVQLLLLRGADPNVADKCGRRPLHWAAYYDWTEKAQMLIESGTADLNLTDKDGKTPLHLAVLMESKEIAKLLIDNGARNQLSMCAFK